MNSEESVESDRNENDKCKHKHILTCNTNNMSLWFDKEFRTPDFGHGANESYVDRTSLTHISSKLVMLVCHGFCRIFCDISHSNAS